MSIKVRIYLLPTNLPLTLTPFSLFVFVKLKILNLKHSEIEIVVHLFQAAIWLFHVVVMPRTENYSSMGKQMYQEL